MQAVFDEEREALIDHARKEIKNFLTRLDYQKVAQRQGMPELRRMEAISAFTLPPEYDPHTIRTSERINVVAYPRELREPSNWNPEQTLLLKVKQEEDITICSNASCIDFGSGDLAETEARDWERDYNLSKGTAITSNPIYWSMLGGSYPSKGDTNPDESAPGTLAFARLQAFCTMLGLRECSSTRCQILRQRLERALPPCDAWPHLRDWILVADSCQLSASESNFLWLGEFLLDHAMSFLSKFWHENNNFKLESLAFDISELFWFHRTQVEPNLRVRGLDYPITRRFKSYARERAYLEFDRRIFYKASQAALTKAAALNICRKRVWDLVFISRRRHADLPSILRLIQSAPDPAAFAHEDHQHCTPEFCESANINTAAKVQLHKCSTRSCESVEFPVSEVTKSILDSHHIAWSLANSLQDDIEVKLTSFTETSDASDDQSTSGVLAISHVWSDGTGAGVQRPGLVNQCLVKFFLDLAKFLGCSEIWWDIICVPLAETDEEKKARQIAISRMHKNFADAKHVVIHDEYLLRIPWAEDGTPAVALVLSPWFSRGWTALELSVSRSVKVLYRHPTIHNEYVVKDLHEDVLVSGPFGCLGQVAASFVIEKLLGRPKTLLDLITILSTRSTSWNRDRMAIAALLARVKQLDYSSPRAGMTQFIIALYGKFRRTLLHHEQAPLVDQGPFAWCPSNLFLNPPELLKHWDSNALDETADVRLCLDDNNYGSVLGFWECTILDKSMVDTIKPVATHLHVYRVLDNLAANKMILLHSGVAQLPDLLVIATGLWHSEENETPYVHCHYVGCVTITPNDHSTAEHMQRQKFEGLYRFSVGSRGGEKIFPAKPLLEKARDTRVIVISQD